jgi:hypothetical protein
MRWRPLQRAAAPLAALLVAVWGAAASAQSPLDALLGGAAEPDPEAQARALAEESTLFPEPLALPPKTSGVTSSSASRLALTGTPSRGCQRCCGTRSGRHFLNGCNILQQTQ